jgi:hypothetical protein
MWAKECLECVERMQQIWVRETIRFALGGMMEICTVHSMASDGGAAASELCANLNSAIGGATPSLLVVYANTALDKQALLAGLSEHFPGVPTIGGTSCTGAMTDAGCHVGEDRGVAMMAIIDPDGSYGVGCAEIGDEPRAAAAAAIEAALESADRPYETPHLVWCFQAPGTEESLLAGVAEVVGESVPVVGGSSGDNDVSGNWSQFANGEVHSSAVVYAVMFPSKRVGMAFHNGYEPTSSFGRVTRAEGRTLKEIDGRPAAEVYNEWTDGAIAGAMDGGGNVLMDTTLYPLGRVSGEIRGVRHFVLSHPDAVYADGGMSTFSDVAEGDLLHLMHGTTESLVARAANVAREALRAADLGSDQIAGALVIYCAGCMLTVGDAMSGVVEGLTHALGQNPFIGAFTFGEEGYSTVCSRHGNLMISVVVFEK